MKNAIYGLHLVKLNLTALAFSRAPAKRKETTIYAFPKETIHGKGAQNIVSKCTAGVAAASEGERKAS